MTTLATARLKSRSPRSASPKVPEFLQQIVDSGGHRGPAGCPPTCSTWDRTNLYEGVEGHHQRHRFIEMTDGAQLLFI
jgi:hypothetical protein